MTGLGMAPSISSTRGVAIQVVVHQTALAIRQPVNDSTPFVWTLAYQKLSLASGRSPVLSASANQSGRKLRPQCIRARS